MTDDTVASIGSAKIPGCQQCGIEIRSSATGRLRRYCSDACKHQASRARSKAAARASRNDWWTPQQVRDRVLRDFDVVLDAAASDASALVPEWLGPTHPDEGRRDALTVPWSGSRGVVWCNPPYGRTLLSKFMHKIRDEAGAGARIVALVPASVGTKWWAECVNGRAEVEFLTGRLKFEGPHSTGDSAAFDSALLFYNVSSRG